MVRLFFVSQIVILDLRRELRRCNTYCIQVKPVGRREVKNESQGEERNSSWKFVLRSVNAL